MMSVLQRILKVLSVNCAKSEAVSSALANVFLNTEKPRPDRVVGARLSEMVA